MCARARVRSCECQYTYVAGFMWRSEDYLFIFHLVLFTCVVQASWP